MKRDLQRQKNDQLLSVILPAYKAEKFIEKNLLQVKGALDQMGREYEIICVVDGKIDKTYENAKKVAKKFPKLVRAVGYLVNLGKGHAVRYGMAKAKGGVIGFIDAGMEIDPNGLSMLLSHFEWYKADVVVGSKRHPVSKGKYPWQRRILSFGYQMLVKVLFGLTVKDTQAGLKVFRREVLVKTMPRLLVKDFAFDIEMLSVANYLGYSKIYEAPIEMKTELGGSSVLTSRGFIRYALGMLKDTLAVFYRLRILRYYDYNNRKNWITPEYLTLNKKS
jgi:glycosyltransferase involved in cell wall biosynthesis